MMEEHIKRNEHDADLHNIHICLMAIGEQYKSVENRLKILERKFERMETKQWQR